VFHPDARNNLTLLAFVQVSMQFSAQSVFGGAIVRSTGCLLTNFLSLRLQSCDTVYKRFRFFKASVSNASVIDNQLERIVNYFFWLIQGMMVLFIMQINPWPLLVSMTSLLVSVSFALGPSLSKYVEGILLIAVRRPFDLGDRILINSTESTDSAGGPMGWFVEGTLEFYVAVSKV